MAKRDFLVRRKGTGAQRLYSAVSNKFACADDGSAVTFSDDRPTSNIIDAVDALADGLPAAEAVSAVLKNNAEYSRDGLSPMLRMATTDPGTFWAMWRNFHASGSCGVPKWDAKCRASQGYYAGGAGQPQGDLPEEVILMRVTVEGEGGGAGQPQNRSSFQNPYAQQGGGGGGGGSSYQQQAPPRPPAAVPAPAPAPAAQSAAAQLHAMVAAAAGKGKGKGGRTFVRRQGTGAQRLFAGATQKFSCAADGNSVNFTDDRPGSNLIDVVDELVDGGIKDATALAQTLQSNAEYRRPGTQGFVRMATTDPNTFWAVWRDFHANGSCAVPAWDAKCRAVVGYFATSGGRPSGDLPEEVLLMRVTIEGE